MPAPEIAIPAKPNSRDPKMKLNVAVQMDPIARINIRGDSTFALLLEAQRRGHGLFYYTPDKLSLRGEELIAPIQILSVRDEPGGHFTLGGRVRRPRFVVRRPPPATGPPIRTPLDPLNAFSRTPASKAAGGQQTRQRAQ